MEFIEIPLPIAQKAMRKFRPLVPYVRKRMAELRRERNELEEAEKLAAEVEKKKPLKKSKAKK